LKVTAKEHGLSTGNMKSDNEFGRNIMETRQGSRKFFYLSDRQVLHFAKQESVGGLNAVEN